MSLLDEALGHLLFPTYCVGCQRLGPFLCNNCRELIEFYVGEVELQLEPLYLDSVAVATYYQYPIDLLIQTMKYRSVKEIAPFLGDLLFQTVIIPYSDLITFVPMPSHRQRWRGFNQAELIAAKIGQQTLTPVLPLLQRSKQLTPQATQGSRADRLRHQHNTISLAKKTTPLQGKIILILDDVLTTGSTLNECAKVLKNEGAAEVHALVVAHG